MTSIIPVILCGGSGSRLWPLSRDFYPKQFLNIIEDTSLFKKSIKRLVLLEKAGFDLKKIIVVTNENQRFLVLQQLNDLKLNFPFQIILEPMGRNTAPALTLASFAANDEEPDSNLIVMPSDHFIQNEKEFICVLESLLDNLQDNQISTLGIPPSHPSDEFGYIKYSGSDDIKSVVKFIEKPSVVKAKNYLNEGEFAWNSGIFILKPTTWLKAIKNIKEIYEPVLSAWKKSVVDGVFIRPNQKDFSNSASESIDYAVMENFKKLNIDVNMSILSAGWSDLGNFFSLGQTFDSDDNGNHFSGDILSLGSFNNIAKTTKNNLTLFNVKDLIVIEADDAILITDINSSNKIKEVVDLVKLKKPELMSFHKNVHRPWGSFDVLYSNQYCKVKKILINPGHQISYQSHKFRSEHWVVVNGNAKLIINDNEKFISSNESVYIPAGTKHQLINDNDNILEIIEVQTGVYLEEDDIIRYNDIYKR